MLSLKNLDSASGAKQYYASIKEYYQGGNDKALSNTMDVGFKIEWQGGALQALFGSKKPTADDFEKLLKGELPNGQVLGRMVDGKRQHSPGMDLTFSAPKSFAIMAFLFGDKRLIDVHNDAVTKTNRIVEQTLLQTRIKGEAAPAQRAAIYKVLEFLSRDQDMLIHTHNVYQNMCQGEDGVFRSLHNPSIYDNQKLIGLIYRSYAMHGAQKIGYEIEITGKDCIFEIKGVAKSMIRLFSKRRVAIEAMAEKAGRDDAKFMEKANLATRKNKEAPQSMAAHIERWKNEAKEHGFDISKGHESFITQNGHVAQNTKKIAMDAIQAGIAKLDEHKRFYTKHEVIYEASKLAFGKALPHTIEKSWEKAEGTGLVRQLSANEKYFVSMNNVAIKYNLIKQANAKPLSKFRSKLVGKVVSRYIMHGVQAGHEGDNAVYKNIIDFITISNKRAMIVDNLCPHADKNFIQESAHVAKHFKKDIRHINVSRVDRVNCGRAGLKTWSLDYLKFAIIKPNSVFVVHGSEKLLFSQKELINDLALQYDCKVIWSNNKDLNKLDRRYSAIELVAPYLPRVSFEANTSCREGKNYRDDVSVNIQVLQEDKFVEQFSKLSKPGNDAILLSYDKIAVNYAVREMLKDEGKLNKQCVAIQSYVHQYATATQLARPNTYKKGDVLRINDLDTISFSKKSEDFTYNKGDHYEIKTIKGSMLTLAHGKNNTEHTLNLDSQTLLYKDVAIFRPTTIEIAKGDKLILPAHNIYGERFQNQVGEVIAANPQCISLKIQGEENPFKMHLQDKNGFERKIYLDHGYCAHPSTRLPESIQDVAMDFRVAYVVNGIKTLGIHSKDSLGLYTDNISAMDQALKSIEFDVGDAHGSAKNTPYKPNYEEIIHKQSVDTPLRSQEALLCVGQALEEITQMQAVFKKNELTQIALSKGAQTLDRNDITHAVNAYIDAGKIVDKNKGFLASQAVIDKEKETIKMLETNLESLKQEASGSNKIKPIAAQSSLVSAYLKRHGKSLLPEYKEAIQTLTLTHNPVPILQGYAGVAKTSNILHHVAKILKNENFQVLGVAPMHTHCNSLEKKADIKVMTVAQLIQYETSNRLGDKIEFNNTAILVDESSMLGLTQVWHLAQIAAKYRAKMIFCGDKFQLDPVGLSRIFHTLQEGGKIKASEVRHIYRQEYDLYRESVYELIEKGAEQGAESFVKFMVPEGKITPIQELVASYKSLSYSEQLKTMIITLSNSEREEINQMLQVKDSASFKQMTLRPMNIPEKTRYDAGVFEADGVIKFNQSIKEHNIPAQSYYQVLSIDYDKNKLRLAPYNMSKTENQAALTIELDPFAARLDRKNLITCYEVREQQFAVGDKVVLSDNIKEQKLFNSSEALIENFDDKTITLQLEDKLVTLNRNKISHCVLGLGYAMTTHKSQSKDAKRVLLLFDTRNRYLANLKSFYVGVTRGKSVVNIFTNNVEHLIKATKESYHVNRSAVEEIDNTKPQDKGLILGAAPSIKKNKTIISEPSKKLINIDHLTKKLNENPEQVAQAILGRPKSRSLVALKFGNKKSKGDGSLSVTVSGQKTGWWYDFATLKGGRDFISLIIEERGVSFREALNEAVKLSGMSRGNLLLEQDNIRKKIPTLKLGPASEEIQQKLEKLEKVQGYLKQSTPARGTLAEKYLVVHRKIPSSIVREYPEKIRYIEHFKFKPSDRRSHPALALPMRDAKNTVTGMQVIILDRETGEKNKTLNNSKISYGAMKGASIQLGNPKGKTFIVEGPETGLSLLATSPNHNFHITCSLSNMANAPLPKAGLESPRIGEITLCADYDGPSAKSHLGLYHTSKNFTQKYGHVKVIMPPAPLDNSRIDFNDILQDKGLQGVKEAFTTAQSQALNIDSTHFTNLENNKTIEATLQKDFSCSLDGMPSQHKERAVDRSR